MKKIQDFCTKGLAWLMRRKVLIFACVVAMAAIWLFAGLARAEYQWGQKETRFSVLAGESLAKGDVLAIKDSDGKAYKADMDAATLNYVAGIAGNAAASGARVEVIVRGVLAGFTGLGEGQPLLASSVAGGYTIIRLPGLNQQVGVGTSSTTALINICERTGNDVVTVTTNTTLTNAHNGKTITNAGATGAVTLTLPDATVGYELAVSNTENYTITINPQDTDQILGLTNAAGDSVWFDAAGEGLVLKAAKAGKWNPTATYGTFTDGN